MSRGEIWTTAGSGYASKPRPALILQDDLFFGTDSVTVVLLTSADTDAPLTRVAIPADSISGLDLPSWAMIDKIMTVKRRGLARFVGRLTSAQMAEVERLILVFLGMAS